MPTYFLLYPQVKFTTRFLFSLFLYPDYTLTISMRRHRRADSSIKVSIAGYCRVVYKDVV